MAESSNPMVGARILLATPNHDGLVNVVDQLFMHQHQTDEYHMARALYHFCVDNFSNCLTLMLLKVYRYSRDDPARFRSISLLSETLADLRNRRFELSLVALNDIKPLLISCLTIPEANKSDTKILGRIVSFVAFNVVKLDNRGWDDLSDCMLRLVNTHPRRAFNVFLDLPLLDEGFINRFLNDLLGEVYKELFNPELDREEDWTLALETAIKLGIQLSGSETKLDLSKEILDTVLESADGLVMKGNGQFLERGLAHLVEFLAQDSNLCGYSRKQCRFVGEFAVKISRIGTYTEEAVRKIYQMVTMLESHVSDRVQQPVEKQGSDLELYNSLEVLSAVDILDMVVVTEMNDRAREKAIRRVHDLLCDHTSRKVEIDVSEMRRLQKLLMSCLREAGMPISTFKILGQVVFHVAHEMLSNQEDKWSDLWDYIASECKRQFERTIYIFQCLTMMLDDKHYVIPAIDNLLPEISRRLNPPIESLADNSCWVLAFVGAFCAAIHLLDSTSHSESVKEIVDKMIDSVRERVERGIEVGLVSAFSDLESIVKKQLDWYDASEYRFIKALLWKLYEIKGLKMESKMVLWRLNVILERGTPNVEDKESLRQKPHSVPNSQ